MPKKGSAPPESAIRITIYAELEELLAAFVEGYFSLLIVLGRPGLSKSRSLCRAIGPRKALVIKGRKSPIDLYIDLYAHQDEPVILDDADDLMGQKLCREIVKALTETDEHKRLEWGTQTKILEEEGVPNHFFTASSTCIVTNCWSDKDPIYSALESRAEFIYFDPSWEEVYRQAARWYWDQEILDYLHQRLSILKQPDVRLLVKASQRKKACLRRLDWRKLIDGHCDDEMGLVLRQLLDDESYPHNTARAEAFCKRTGAERTTFYRRMKRIKQYRPKGNVERLALDRNYPPRHARPADGCVAKTAEFEPDTIPIPVDPLTRARQLGLHVVY